VGRIDCLPRLFKHFCSWLGLCPGQKITGGNIKSSKTRPVENRAANAFRMAAFALTRSRSALGAPKLLLPPHIRSLTAHVLHQANPCSSLNR
jgi:hypothetical protein